MADTITVPAPFCNGSLSSSSKSDFPSERESLDSIAKSLAALVALMARPVVAPAPAVDLETLAIAALTSDGPNLRGIARSIGIDHKKLYTLPKFMKCYRIARPEGSRGKRPSGYKSGDGEIDAWDDEK